jgi:hypothetical protein
MDKVQRQYKRIRKKIVVVAQSSTPVLGPTPTLQNNGHRVSVPVVKRPGRGLNHPPPSSAEVKERVELYLYSPSELSWPVLGKKKLLCSMYIVVNLTETHSGFCEERTQYLYTASSFYLALFAAQHRPLRVTADRAPLAAVWICLALWSTLFRSMCSCYERAFTDRIQIRYCAVSVQRVAISFGFLAYLKKMFSFGRQTRVTHSKYLYGT